jgi:sulfatase maturation enzyme AslB (radical SAM superfamily)
MNKWFKTDTYRNNLKNSAMELKRVYMTGGEPTLIKENCTLLEYLVECGNTDCHVSFTTNGTTADTKILSLLTHFKNAEIQVSCDAVGDRAHYVRYPTVWNDYVENVSKIAAIERVRLVYYTVVSAYNLYDLSNILEYVDSVGAHREVTWVPIFLDYPDYMRTTIWPLTLRNDALKKIKTTWDNCGNIKRWINQPGLWEQTWDKIKNHYCHDENSDTSHERLNTFLECNGVLDSKRGTNFAHTFPELKE